ncbi:SLBB domain-containing protein [Limnobacter sp.]|uniref:SLBB domain-containing protein n=1 Tax=Limnobacter sp. TaxID=2003368 RepID=UPI0035129DEE
MQGFTKALLALVVSFVGLAGVAHAQSQSSSQQLPFPFSNAPSATARQGGEVPVMGGASQGGMGANPFASISQTQASAAAPVADQAPQPLNANKPLTPFQQFVLEATGRRLPNFGDSALQKELPRDRGNQPVATDYEIGPGDEINIRVWGAININTRAVVDREGQLSIPTVGTFPVAGVRASGLDDFLKAEMGKVYKNFNLSASLGKLGGVNIYVAGQALLPGMHTVSSTSTLASVLFNVAQPGINGSYRNVQLKRGGQTVASFDLYQLLREGVLTGDRKLQSGDVVFVGSAGPRVALNIEGPAAAIFELKPGETLSDVLALSGADTTLLRQDTVLLEGFNPSNPAAPRAVEQLAYQRAVNEVKLKDGDIVTLFAVRREFANAVTLKGAVADPARYPYMPGMTVADLIPNTDVLIQPSYFKKKNALVGVVEEAEEQEKNTAPSNLQQVLAKENNPDSRIEVIRETVRSLVDQINWEYAVIERLDKREIKPLVVPFNLKKAMARDPQHNLVLQPGDIVTVFSTKDADIPKSRKTALVKVVGEVKSPGFYQVVPGETLRDVLVKAGGLTEDAYLFGTRLMRKSIQQQQEEQYQRALEQAERLLLAASNSNAASALNAADAANVQAQTQKQQLYLERLKTRRPDGRVVLDVPPKAMAIAELPPLVLDDGDTITIPTVPGQVGIFGSVFTQGAFAYEGGKTVFDYLNMAGGAAKSADDGSIFVLRANGTVDSAQQGWVPFVSGLHGRRALPGDVIYVPEDFERVSFMKGLLDISQIFYQVGLGAAAIKAIQD